MDHYRRVYSIYVAPKAGAPMEYRREVEAKAGAGLLGDRYATDEGNWKTADSAKILHVTLIGLEDIRLANSHLRQSGLIPFAEDETRRNIVTIGVFLHTLIGKEFTVCGVRMRGVELAKPCSRPGKLIKKKGFVKEFNGLAGIRAEIRSCGLIFADGPIAL
jgi:hypothetical protein